MLVRHALSQLSYAPKMPEILSVKTSKSLRFFRSHTLSYPKSVRLSNGFTRVFNNYTGFARTKALHCDTPGELSRGCVHIISAEGIAYHQYVRIVSHHPENG